MNEGQDFPNGSLGLPRVNYFKQDRHFKGWAICTDDQALKKSGPVSTVAHHWHCGLYGSLKAPRGYAQGIISSQTNAVNKLLLISGISLNTWSCCKGLFPSWRRLGGCKQSGRGVKLVGIISAELVRAARVQFILAWWRYLCGQSSAAWTSQSSLDKLPLVITSIWTAHLRLTVPFMQLCDPRQWFLGHSALLWKDDKLAIGLCWATPYWADLGVFYLGSQVSALLWVCPLFLCKNLIQKQNNGLSGLPQKPRRHLCW